MRNENLQGEGGEKEKVKGRKEKGGGGKDETGKLKDEGGGEREKSGKRKRGGRIADCRRQIAE